MLLLSIERVVFEQSLRVGLRVSHFLDQLHLMENLLVVFLPLPKPEIMQIYHDLLNYWRYETVGYS